MNAFAPEVVTAVLTHMNDDHTLDNLIVAHGYGYPEATTCVMDDFDAHGGTWTAVDPEGAHTFTIAWPGGEISERPEIRREVVAVCVAARERIGSFAQVIRNTSWPDHQATEGSSFMGDIMRGVAPLDDYTALVAQHWYMYHALESRAKEHAGDRVMRMFDQPELHRLAAIERDLEHLLGDTWRDQLSAVPATQRYADRIREVADEGWLPGLIAHHYTRYLGDMSGGQMIARRMQKLHGLDGAGIAFYDFAALGDLTDYKNRYRAQLDELGYMLTESERQRFLDEVGLAYRFNSEVFEDLAAEKLGSLAR